MLMLQVTATIVFTWTVGPIYFLSFGVTTAEVTHSGDCTVYSVYPSAVAQSAVGALTVFVQFVVPLIFLAVFYGRMAFVLHKRVESVAQPG